MQPLQVSLLNPTLVGWQMWLKDVKEVVYSSTLVIYQS